MNKYIKSAIALLLGLPLLLTACHDNAEPTPVKIIDPSISNQSPELYQAYLKSLRDYKANPHTQVFVWFDNSVKIPGGQAQNISAIPDSVDVVALMYPDRLTDLELKEMEQIRQKSTQVISTIDFDAIQDRYTTLVEQKTPNLKDFDAYLLESVSSSLRLVDAYGYDGICVGYKGKAVSHLEEAERTSVERAQRLFFALLRGWADKHKDKLFVFRGLPQNIIDSETRTRFSTFLIPGESATTTDAFSFLLNFSKTEDIADRLGITVEYIRLNDTNKAFGYLGDGTLQVEGLIQWLKINQYKQNLAAVGLYNLSADYYNASGNYRYTRQLIQVLNPSLR